MSVPESAVGSETELLQCPYEISHMIMRKRFQVHLVRCRKNHPKAEVVTCPFNVTHRVNKVELEWHLSNCFDRKSFENFRNRPAPVVGLSSSIDRTFCESDATNRSLSISLASDVTIVGGEFVEPTESWDDEPQVPSYNPTDYIHKADVLRMPVGMTPSERNAFRLAERKRLQSLAK
ncbi:gametocyte-specific factor 1 homolog [Musca vetustissima]|uniref:gametocyte-specific factor 1 homolog n=1 Tax=Musca vetustissima TaxID=27455 RepID=UPI002AB73B28|nr:gametocyte-specific factor 1 homolog [Musca vetustissima]